MDSMDLIREELHKQMNKARWQGYMSGKALGALVILDFIKLPQDQWIAVLCDSMGYSIKEAADYMDSYLCKTGRID